MKPTHFQIEFTNERIIPSGGLPLVGHILENRGFIDRSNSQDATGKRSGHQIKNGGILGSYIGCLYMGKPTEQYCMDRLSDRWPGLVYAFGLEPDVYRVSWEQIFKKSACFSDKYQL